MSEGAAAPDDPALFVTKVEPGQGRLCAKPGGDLLVLVCLAHVDPRDLLAAAPASVEADLTAA